MANSELKALKKLVSQFAANIDRYKNPAYDETTTRIDFINKFFTLLGWDMDNHQGFSEDRREVIHEDKVRIKGKTKAPDYGFQLKGRRQFFVEAKKPSVNIKDDTGPALQIRRYGYTAKLALCILTDFEEFAVYDTRIKPNKNDKASVARVFYFRFEDYAEKWDEISTLFSKTAVLNGSLEAYLEKHKKAKGTSEVDKEFLKMIEGWRSEIARNLALRNKNLSVHELNYAVTKIIDRIIFLRIAEDRQTEPYGALQKISGTTGIYKGFDKLCREADAKYNSGLFKIEDFLSNLKLDDQILKKIFKNLYFPDCPYEFSVLGVEILGQIYEQFLGKTIRLTAGHQAKIEEKPEVRKAGGVYYTPQYIVEYIVKNTVGEKLKSQTPKKISELTICDPACGSGSFLIGAFDCLLNWHLEYYTARARLKKSLKDEIIYQFSETTYRLTINEKRRILENNIFGVDIDRHAVEVTKLSLLLKLMENENQESAWRLFKESQMQILPDLSSNIKCGNSLIGPDYYDGQNLTLFDDDQTRKINVFDWDEAFPQVFEKSGFDVVIGNPPYVSITGIENALKGFYGKHFKTAKGRFDLFNLFIEKSIYLLKSGYLSFIIPNKFLTNTQSKILRQLMLRNGSIKKIAFSPSKIFLGASVNSIVFIFQKEKINKGNCGIFKINKGLFIKENEISNHIFLSDEDNRFLITLNLDHVRIKEKVEENKLKLSEIAEVRDGIVAGRIKDKLFHKIKINETCKPLLFGSDINRYHKNFSQNYVDYREVVMKNHERKRVKGKGLGLRLRFPALYEREKILTRKVGDKIIAAFDDENYYYEQTLHSTHLIDSDFDNLFILGILNSNLLVFYYQTIVKQTGTIFPQVRIAFLKSLPIPRVDQVGQKPISYLVEKMIDTQKRLNQANLEADKKMYERQARALDKKIDQMVYELYGLTPEEIKIVEAETAP